MIMVASLSMYISCVLYKYQIITIQIADNEVIWKTEVYGLDSVERIVGGTGLCRLSLTTGT